MNLKDSFLLEERVMLEDALEGKLDVNKRSPTIGLTPFMMAAAKGNIHVMRILRGMGADVMAKSNNGMTAADWAKHNNQFEAQQEAMKMVSIAEEKLILLSLCNQRSESINESENNNKRGRL